MSGHHPWNEIQTGQRDPGCVTCARREAEERRARGDGRRAPENAELDRELAEEAARSAPPLPE